MTADTFATLQTRTGTVTLVRARIVTYPMVTALMMLQDLHHRSVRRGSPALRSVATLQPAQAQQAYRLMLLTMLGQFMVLSQHDRLGMFTRTLAFVAGNGGYMAGLESLMVTGIAAAREANRHDLVREGIGAIGGHPGRGLPGNFAGGRGLTPFWDPSSSSIGFFDESGFGALAGTLGDLANTLGFGGMGSLGGGSAGGGPNLGGSRGPVWAAGMGGGGGGTVDRPSFGNSVGAGAAPGEGVTPGGRLGSDVGGGLRGEISSTQSGPGAPMVGPNMHADGTAMCVAGWGYLGATAGTGLGAELGGPAGSSVLGAAGSIAGSEVGEVACRPEFSVAAGRDEITDPTTGAVVGSGNPNDSQPTAPTPVASPTAPAPAPSNEEEITDPLTGMVIGKGASGSGGGGMVDPDSPHEGQEGNPHRTFGKKSHPTLTYPTGVGVGGFVLPGGPRTLVASDMPQLSPGAVGLSKQGAMTQLSVLMRVNPVPDSDTGADLPYIAAPNHDLQLGPRGGGGPTGPITVNPRDLQARFGARIGNQLEALLRDLAQR